MFLVLDMMIGAGHLDTDCGNSYPQIHCPIDLKPCSTNYLMTAARLIEVDCNCLPPHFDSDVDTRVSNLSFVCTVKSCTSVCSSPLFSFD